MTVSRFVVGAFVLLLIPLAVLIPLPGAVVLAQTFDNPTPTSYDFFGYSVAIDGERVLIGAPNDDTLGPNVGQAYLFDASTGELLRTFDNPMPEEDPEFSYPMAMHPGFGHSVAIDGDRVLIGVYMCDWQNCPIGQAHLFDASTGELLRTFDDPTPERVGPLMWTVDEPRFGDSLAIDGDRVLIGDYWWDYDHSEPVSPAGQAHLFDASTGELLRTFNDPTPTRKDKFGLSVAIDGARILIGAPGDDTLGLDVGQAHLFDASTGELVRTFDDPAPTVVADFGYSLAIDGDRVLIGNPSRPLNSVGEAHLFDATTGALLRTFDDPTLRQWVWFGYSVAIDGDRVVIGARSCLSLDCPTGQAHLFDASTGGLSRTFDDPTPTGVDDFGYSLAIDGDRVLIGAPYDSTLGFDVGQAHLFDITGALLPWNHWPSIPWPYGPWPWYGNAPVPLAPPSPDPYGVIPGYLRYGVESRDGYAWPLGFGDLGWPDFTHDAYGVYEYPLPRWRYRGYPTYQPGGWPGYLSPWGHGDSGWTGLPTLNFPEW